MKMTYGKFTKDAKAFVGNVPPSACPFAGVVRMGRWLRNENADSVNVAVVVLAGIGSLHEPVAVDAAERQGAQAFERIITASVGGRDFAFGDAGGRVALTFVKR